MSRNINKLIILNENTNFKEITLNTCINYITELLQSLRRQYITDAGIDYERLRQDAFFERNHRPVDCLRGLTVTHHDSDEARCSLYINLYNLLTIHALMSLRPTPDLVSSMAYTHRYAYLIGRHVFTLHDILHVLIRVNRPPPMSTRLSISEGDPRLQYAVSRLDPRIHFAITNGAKDSPRFNVYTAVDLDLQLTTATRRYFDLYLRAVVQHRSIIIPQILHWYERDFGGNDLLAIQWSLNYLEHDRASDLRSLIRTMENEGTVDINYRPFDWSLNSIPITSS